MVRDRAGSLVRFEAALSTIQGSPLFARYGIDALQPPSSMSAPDLLDAANTANRALHAIESATNTDSSAQEVQGVQTPVMMLYT